MSICRGLLTGYPWLVAQLDHLCTDHRLFVMMNLLVVMMTPCTGGEIAAATLNIFSSFFCKKYRAS